MRSNNPVFSSIEKRTNDVSSTTGVATRGGIAVKTLILLAITAGVGLFLPNLSEDILIGGLMFSGIIALVSVIVASVSHRLAMPFSIIYAVAQGFTVGFLTHVVEIYVPGIAVTALISTGVIIAVMITLYATNIIKATRRLYRFVIGSLIAFIISSLLLLIVSLINPEFSATIMNNFGINIVVVGFAIVLGALMLVLDLDRADRIVSMQAPKSAEWQASLGFLVSVIWIYIQLLRLLLIFASRSRN